MAIYSHPFNQLLLLLDGGTINDIKNKFINARNALRALNKGKFLLSVAVDTRVFVYILVERILYLHYLPFPTVSKST